MFLAAQRNGEIVNCDSMQVYRGFNIGTAKDMRPGVAHHLFDILDPMLDPIAVCTAGDYARRATRVLHDIASRGNTPVVVGGTGLYLRALIDGLAPAPLRNQALRAKLDMRDAARLHRVLTRLDRATAERIHPNDKSKTIRAIEVCLEARRPMSHVLADGRRPLEGFDVLKIGLDPPRAALYSRINERTRLMYERGLVEEARTLLAGGVPENAKPWEAPGYSEALAVVRGELAVEAAIDLTQRRTRQYAKRQMTWFRKDAAIQWLEGFGDDPGVQAGVMRVLDRR